MTRPTRHHRQPRRFDDFDMAVYGQTRPPVHHSDVQAEPVCNRPAVPTDYGQSFSEVDPGMAVPEPFTDSPSNGSGGSRSTRRHRQRRRRSVPSLEATAPTAYDAGVGDWSPEVIRDMQLRDGDIAPALAWLESGIRPPWEDVQACSPMLRALWQQHDSLSVRNGILYRSFYDNKGMVIWYQLVLPSEIKVLFLELIHADTAGHLKYAKCVPHVMRRAWWLHWKRDLNLFIRCCSKLRVFIGAAP